jgi:hypothetical protein
MFGMKDVTPGVLSVGLFEHWREGLGTGGPNGRNNETILNRAIGKF